jgi:hypothetical protein
MSFLDLRNKMIDKVPAIKAMMKYRDWILCNDTIG